MNGTVGCRSALRKRALEDLPPQGPPPSKMFRNRGRVSKQFETAFLSFQQLRNRQQYIMALVIL